MRRSRPSARPVWLSSGQRKGDRPPQALERPGHPRSSMATGINLHWAVVLVHNEPNAQTRQRQRSLPGRVPFTRVSPDG
jgi:hypothetical protein